MPANEMKGEDEGALDSCGVVLSVLYEDEVSQDEAKGTEGNADDMEKVDGDLREQIAAQLLSVEPIFAECGRTALHRAAAGGLGKAVARLLAACPFLVDVAEPLEMDSGTVLHSAARNGHATIVAQLLAARPALADAAIPPAWTALHCAAMGGHEEVVTQLLTANPALIDARVDGGYTALHLAADEGHATVVGRLLAANTALIHAVTEDGHTALHSVALHCAADQGHLAVVAQLLTTANSTNLIHARTNIGWTALFCAVCAGNKEIVAQLLAASPASIEAMANDGSSILHVAVSAHRDDITAQLLAAHPALLDAMINDADRWAALQNVVQMGHAEATARVLAMHPNLIHQTSPEGWTAFHIAARYGRDKVMSWLLAAVAQPDLERLLLRTSTKWEPKAIAGSTALHLACSGGYSNIVTQLLAACPTLVDVSDSTNQTCLHSAAQCARARKFVIDMLLAFKPALVHAVDANGNTILHLLVVLDHAEQVERVWKMSPDALRAVNNDGHTPFHLAVANRCCRKIDLLQWSLTFEEIVCVYSQCGESYVERFKPLMELQCEGLAVSLIPDVVAMVFEYLGFPGTNDEPGENITRIEKSMGS